MDFDSVSVHKHARKALGQYPATLTEQAWSITHISHLTRQTLVFRPTPQSSGSVFCFVSLGSVTAAVRRMPEKKKEISYDLVTNMTFDILNDSRKKEFFADVFQTRLEVPRA